MGFSDGFSRGFAIGDQIKKKKAAEKFFGKLQEFTVDTDEEQQAQAIPMTGGAALPAATAADGSGISIQPQQAALSIEAPAAPRINKEGRLSTLGPPQLRELDDAALEFAKASGDTDGSIYQAASGIMKSRLRDGFRGAMGNAMAAIQSGDTAAAERALKRANFFIPNGQDIDIKKGENGQLIMRNPLTDKDEPVTQQMLSQLARIAEDPIAAGQYIDQMLASAREADQKDRQLGQKDRELTGAEARTAIDASEAAERARSNRANESIAGRRVALDEQMAPFEQDYKAAQTIQSLRYADYLKGGKDGGKKGGITAADQARLSNDIFNRLGAVMFPQRIEMVPDPTFPGKMVPQTVPMKPPAGLENVSRTDQNRVARVAEKLMQDNEGMTLAEAVDEAVNGYLARKQSK